MMKSFMRLSILVKSKQLACLLTGFNRYMFFWNSKPSLVEVISKLVHYYYAVLS